MLLPNSDCGLGANLKTIMGNVVLDPNPIKTSVRLDFEGNEINPKTKQIIKPKESDSILPPTPSELPVEVVKTSITITSANSGALSILDQIEQAEKNLANLKELKRLEIEKKKKELELLQQ